MWLLPSAQAEALQPDPAWRQGGLPTGFSWQLVSTPQRPNDRIELRLRINTGSLAESSQQIGSAHLLQRLSLGHSGSLSTLQLRSLWQQSLDDERPLPLAISSYDFTIYNLSLLNNRPDLLKDALVWLSDITGKLALNEHGVQTVMSVCIDPVGTFPPNLQDAWWRCRLKGSTLAAQDPDQPVKLPVNVAQLSKLFAAYAHTGTDVLMSQRLGSQQRGVVDIALEQYQRLRQTFLFGLTLEALDWELKLQLSQDVTLALKQPEGEPEMSMKQLQETYNSIMSTASCGGESCGS